MTDPTPGPTPPRQRGKVLVARARPVLLVSLVVVLFGSEVAGVVGMDVADPPLWVFLFVFGLLAVTMYLPALAVRGDPVVVRAAPVRGRWLAMNSVATKVPSHGTLGYGQSHAIDLVGDPVDESRPTFGDGAHFRAPEEYPAFGNPVLAPDDGVVVATSDWRRDHRSRSSWPALAYMLGEGLVREVGGAGFVIGNHVVVRREDGRFVLLAHLRKGSVTVAEGDHVAAGQEVASCGNSGNSSEPHLHFQVMDHRRPSVAAGLPFAWERTEIEGDGSHGIPANGSHLVA